MSIFATLISGVMVGVEWFDDGEDRGLVVDLFIVRLLFVIESAERYGD